MHLPGRVALSSAGVRSSSAPVVRAVIRNVLELPPALQDSRRVAGRCTPHALPRAAHREVVPASVRVQVAQAVDPASVSVPAWVPVLVVVWFHLQVKHRALSVRAARHAAVDASSIQRPRKAR